MSSLPPCPDEQALRDYGAGTLPEAAAEAVRRHLAGCEHCQRRLADLRAGEEASRRATVPGEGPTCPDESAEEEPAESEGGKTESIELLLGLNFLQPAGAPNSLARVGDYDVLGVLGEGAMGVVLKAFDRSLCRAVAIKVLSPQLAASAKARKRFLREARAAAGINHPNVVTIHAANEQAGMPFLVMELVPGVSLRQRIRTGRPFERTSLLRIGAQVADGLAAAHRHGVIHRDIKPANIMLEDGIERVKITDFGLALVARDASRITSVGLAVGTPAYMSPEQVNGEPLGPPSDLFSLGCVLYAMVAGRSPFRANHPVEMARKVADLVPPPLHEVDPGVPPFLSDLVARLLAKRPEERPASAGEVRDLLLGHLAQANLSAQGSGVVPPSRPAPPRRSARWAALAVALVLLAGAVIAWQARTWGPHPTGREPAPPAGLVEEEITVSQAGGAQFRDLAPALAHAGPGATIHILDDAVYAGPVVINDPARLKGLVIDSPNQATVQVDDATQPVVSVSGTAGVILRGVRLQAKERQHCLSVVGNCEGLLLERVSLVQPGTSPAAAAVLWPGATGSRAAPLVLRDSTVRCGQIGVAVLGDARVPASWVRIEGCRMGGPGVHVALEKAVRDVRVTDNVFAEGKCGVSFEVAPDGAAGVVIANNTFFRQDNWLAFAPSVPEQADVTVARNLVLEVDGVKASAEELARVAPRWFRENWWEPGPAADAQLVRLLAEPHENVPVLSRDASSPDFLRPAPGSMPGVAAAGDPARPYVGALAPAQPP